MKQILNKRGKVEVKEVPEPICGENEVLVANVASLISAGTERHSIEARSKNIVALALDFKKTRQDLVKKAMDLMKKEGFVKGYRLIKEKLEEPQQLGYSSAGIVIEVGKNVDDIRVGDRVACGGGDYAVHAEYIRVPKNLCVKIPEGVDFEDAAFTTLGAIALQGVRRADVRIGERVGVIGLGLVGLLTVQILKAAGCTVIGFDIDPKKVEFSKKLGIDEAYCSGDVLPEKVVEFFSEGVGLDAVIITASTSSNKPVEDALNFVRERGRVVVVGSVGMNIPREPFYEKEGDFLISRSYGPGRYDIRYEEKGQDYPIAYVRWTERRNMQAVLNMMAEGRLRIKPLITHRFPVDRAEEAYSVIKEGNAIGVLLEYYRKKEYRLKRKKIVEKVGNAGHINVAIIGAGNFVKRFHLPNLSKIGDVRIYAIASATGANAENIARKYGAAYATTDYRKVVEDKNVNAVIITTRHNLHAKIAIEALRKGKHVFVEKPAAMNMDELEALTSAVEKSKGVFMVGFNRRFSPHISRAMKEIGKTSGPIIVSYIVNAGKLPTDHWIYDPVEGGGRIIGEGVHFIDLVNHIIGDSPVDICVKSIDSSVSSIKPGDNMVITLKYRNGSLGNIIYTSIGNSSYPKETIHIERNGIVVEIIDFKETVIYGKLPKKMKTRKQDKGHKEVMQVFLESVKKGKNAMNASEIYEVHRIAFEIDRMLREGPET